MDYSRKTKHTNDSSQWRCVLGVDGRVLCSLLLRLYTFLLCFLDPNLDVSCNSQVTLSLTSSSPLSKYALEACRVVMVVVVVVVVGGSHDNSCLR